MVLNAAAVRIDHLASQGVCALIAVIRYAIFVAIEWHDSPYRTTANCQERVLVSGEQLLNLGIRERNCPVPITRGGHVRQGGSHRVAQAQIEIHRFAGSHGGRPDEYLGGMRKI